MKKYLLVLIFLSTFYSKNYSQRLVLEGSNVSLKKGTIDTETLSEIIQVKQEEVQQRIFRNMIVTYFWSKNQTSVHKNKLNNFTTQFLIYSLMKDIIEGKNKKNITKNMVGTLSEFSEIYAFATYLILQNKTSTITSVSSSNIENLNDFLVIFKDSLTKKNTIVNDYAKNDRNFKSEFSQIKNLKTDISKLGDGAKIAKTSKENQIEIIENTIKTKYIENKEFFELGELFVSTENAPNNEKKLKVFRGLADESIPFINMLLDMCFDVLLEKSNTFSSNRENQEFVRWFENQSYSKNNFNSLKIDTAKFKKDIRAKYVLFIEKRAAIKQKYLDSKKYLDSIRREPSVYAILTTSEKSKVTDFMTELSSILGETIDPTKVEKIVEYTKNLLELYPLISPTLKSNTNKIDSITKNQFDAMKVILSKLSKLMKGHSKNDIISQLIEIVSDNFEFEIDDNKKGIAYIDIEATISQLFNNFDDRISSGIKMYAKPYLEIGTNTLWVYNKEDENKFTNPLQIASEKIGIKVMLFNFKNARNRKPMEIYRDRLGLTRTWKKAPKEPLFDDISITSYASGLLYNIANIRTQTEFNQPFVGFGLSFRFFNGLALSANYAKTFKGVNLTGKENPLPTDFKRDFVGLNLDIPLIEYIAVARKKRK